MSGGSGNAPPWSSHGCAAARHPSALPAGRRGHRVAGAVHHGRVPLFSFEGLAPTVSPEAWIAPTATLVGDVHVEAGASIWYGAVLRADFGPILVRRGANVQDGSVLHGGAVPPVTGPGTTADADDRASPRAPDIGGLITRQMTRRARFRALIPGSHAHAELH